MGTVFWKCIFNSVYPFFVLTATVKLDGPKYIQRDGTLNAICSSDETPLYTTANFFINGRMYTSLSRSTNGCFSAILRTTCPLSSLGCHCSQDGKEYRLLVHASSGTESLTIMCGMHFKRNGQPFSRNDSLVVQIHDPPILNVDRIVTCNVSSSVQIICSASHTIESFSYWIHSYNGELIRNLSGTYRNNTKNTSIIFIENCDIADVGEYTCRAWNKIENQTYWSNVTTHLVVNGPPMVLTVKTTDKPITFSIVFYSPHKPMSVIWKKDNIHVENFTYIDMKIHEQNISLNMHGKTMIHVGDVTYLTVFERTSSVYSVLLKNEFGMYSHEFKLQAGSADDFNLRTVLWILICIAVFLITITTAAVMFSRRSKSFIKRNEHAERISIYYAAPSTVYNVSQYDSAVSQYEEPVNNTDATRQIIRRRVDAGWQEEAFTEASHYIEIE